MSTLSTSDQKQILPVVAVIVNDEGKFLLTRRNQPESWAHDKWQLAGGGIEFGEHPRDTILREISEELGNLEVAFLSHHPFVHSHHSEERNSHTIVFAYPLQYISGQISTQQDEETAEAKWFRYDEIPFEETIPLTKEAIDDVKDTFNRLATKD